MCLSSMSAFAAYATHYSALRIHDEEFLPQNTTPLNIMSTIHVFSHTHWDREWFLTADHTSSALHDMFTRLFKVIEQCPDYRFILDGQTLMIEDYLRDHPEQEDLIREKAAAGNLLIGPYYGQIDWRVVSEESLIRNLFLGIKDARSYGNFMPYGWLMDNFGHCSQAPQLHLQFGIQELFIWRGPVFDDDAISSDFVWQGSDGSENHANYLMSGYRNFYNLTDTTEFLDQRIDQLTNMLEPFTPHRQLAVLNGYDLDVFPEEPFQFLQGRKNIIRSTPEQYSQAWQRYFEEAGEQPPVIKGELYSGKYACIFPGSLSARTYLRIENALVERLLTYYLEPLQALLSHSAVSVDLEKTEACWRDLLKTQLHDNLGAVGIDQIHDNMETVYRDLYEQAQTGIGTALEYLPSLLDLQQGTYAFMPSPFEYDQVWLRSEDMHYVVSSQGTGVYKVQEERPVANKDITVDEYSWENDFYFFKISAQGATLNGKAVGALTLEKDNGDTYNADPECFEGTPEVETTSLKIVDECDDYAKIAVNRQISHRGIVITTEEKIFLTRSPLVEWTVNVDSEGTDYRLRITYETGDTQSDVFAKMPYDIYQRPRKDTNYFGLEIPQELRPILLAARELDAVADFPFQGFAALSGNSATKAVLAKGLREYEVDERGTIGVTLKRSVQWLAKSSLTTRVGDAGPYMYLPGARDERKTSCELAFVDIKAAVRSPEFLKWFYLFEYGALIFENSSFDGKRSEAKMWEEPLPWSGIQTLEAGKSVIRLYNPFEKSMELSKSYPGSDPFGQQQGDVRQADPKKILNLVYTPELAGAPERSDVKICNFPVWPIGEEHCMVDPARIAELKEKIEIFKQEQAEAKQLVAELKEEDNPLLYHRTQHSVYRLKREIFELELSILLNELKAKGDDAEPELHEKIRDVGEKLNFSRRQRRTYDYVLSLFENRP